MVGEEIKKQENIENIVSMAAERLREDAKPNEMEDDFVSDLFEKAKNTSNPEMQSLWASLLAGEADRPGRFSKRTVAAVSALDKRDAELFTKFCSCCWMLGLTLTPLLTPKTQEILKSRGIGFTELTHLDAIGLIHFDNITGFQQIAEGMETPMEFSLFYFGVPMRVSIQKGPASFEIGNALLTNVGRELAEISGACFDEELRDAAISDIVGNARSMYCDYSGRENHSTT